MSYFADEQTSLRVTYLDGSTRAYTVKREVGEQAVQAFCDRKQPISVFPHTQGVLALDTQRVVALDLHAPSVNASEQSFERVLKSATKSV